MTNLFKKIGVRIEWLRDLANRSALERHYRRNPPPIAHGARQIVVVEGLWDNPNHWLRLWMFLHAILKDNTADVVGILRSEDDWIKRRSLQKLGIRRFLYLNDGRAPEEKFRLQAESLLAKAKRARDLLSLPLPDDLPAYTFVDTVIKQERHPQPAITGNPVWSRVLADLLRLGELYREFFDRNHIIAVVSSHAWKSEWASLCWTAIRRKVPFHYMTAHYNSIRIRRMAAPEDYKAPNEHLLFAGFCALPTDVREKLIERGRAYLAERFEGISDFIVIRYAIKPKLRQQDRTGLLKSLGLDPKKPLVVVYAHSWFDFPHTQAMTNFTDPLDWIRFTLDTIKPLTGVSWAFKPHPCDRWYGNLRLVDLVSGLPPHIAILPEESDSLTVQSAAEALVTIQGSIAIEAAAAGKTVLCADRSMYTDWGFAHTAASREDYAAKLRGITKLAKPTAEQSKRAMAFAATALAPPPEESGSVRLTCDTLYIEGKLYPSLKRLLRQNMDPVREETASLRRWLNSPHQSYNVWRTIDHYMHCQEDLSR